MPVETASLESLALRAVSNLEFLVNRVRSDVRARDLTQAKFLEYLIEISQYTDKVIDEYNEMGFD